MTNAIIDCTSDPHDLVLVPPENAAEARISMEEFRALLEEMRNKQRIVKQIQRDMMTVGVHFGIPGIDPSDADYLAKKGKKKEVLYRPGAGLINNFFNCFAKPAIERDTELPFPHRGYYAKVQIIDRKVGKTVGEGDGYCSTYEPRYRWRDSNPTCPECRAPQIRKDKNSGYYCWAKMGGCGARFPANDGRIQPAGKVENPDLPELHNSVMQMAIKRAEIKATIGAWALGDLFDLPSEEDEMEEAPPPAPSGPPPVASSGQRPTAIISEPQRKRLFAIAGKHNVAATVSEYVKAVYHGADIATLDRTIYDTVVRDIESGAVARWGETR